jgi:hypothetical protein
MSASAAGGQKVRGTPFEKGQDPLIRRETLELVRAYYKVREPRVRKSVFEMVKAVAAGSRAEVLGGAQRKRSAKTLA